MWLLLTCVRVCACVCVCVCVCTCVCAPSPSLGCFNHVLISLLVYLCRPSQSACSPTTTRRLRCATTTRPRSANEQQQGHCVLQCCCSFFFFWLLLLLPLLHSRRDSHRDSINLLCFFGLPVILSPPPRTNETTRASCTASRLPTPRQLSGHASRASSTPALARNKHWGRHHSMRFHFKVSPNVC